MPSPTQVVSYLAGCGLQSCPMLLAKGYPDIGWNPCGGEHYLDFLRFAVFVNGEAGGFGSQGQSLSQGVVYIPQPQLGRQVLPNETVDYGGEGDLALPYEALLGCRPLWVLTWVPVPTRNQVRAWRKMPTWW